jgi:hypothetical protein
MVSGSTQAKKFSKKKRKGRHFMFEEFSVGLDFPGT